MINTYDNEVIYITNLRKILLCIVLFATCMPTYAYTAWIKPVYYSDQQYADGNLYGYLTNAGGILAGVDTQVNASTLLGAGISYFNAKQKDINNLPSQVTINNYQASLYGSYDLYRATYLDWLANAAVNDYKSASYITNSIYATGNHIGQQYSARLILHKQYVKKYIHFTPQINANFVYLHQNSYTAQGINTNNQNIADSNDGIFMLGAGFKMSSTYTRSCWQIRPELRCIVFYDIFSSNINALSAFLIGGPVISTSTMPRRGSGQFEASLIGLAKRNVQCTLSYDLLLKGSYFNNVLALHVRYLFG